jgi:hypothetical protein
MVSASFKERRDCICIALHCIACVYMGLGIGDWGWLAIFIPTLGREGPKVYDLK